MCSVTGLQVDLVMETVQASSYTWYGEVHRHGSGAGFLVANSLCERTELLPTLPHVGPRLARIRVASKFLQGVYAPYMEHCTVKQHKQFYQQVLESHLQLRKVAGSFLTWGMGDFNLPGLVPGRSLQPPANSQASRLGKWYTNLLRDNDLVVLSSPTTHRQGAALDVHITNCDEPYKLNVVTIDHGLSDHSMSIVDIINREATGGQLPRERVTGKCTQFTWSSDPAKWLQALTMMDCYCNHLKCLVHEVTIDWIRSPSDCAQQPLVDLSVLLTDVGLVLGGHKAALAEPARTSKRGDPKLSKYQAEIALHDLMVEHEQAKKDADESPLDASKQVNAVMAWTWLAQAQEQLACQPIEIIVPSGFARAARAGVQNIQRWLSQSTTVIAPSLLVENQMMADRIRKFRTKVTTLDVRCSTSSDNDAYNRAQSLLHLHRGRIKPWTAHLAATGFKGDDGFAQVITPEKTILRLLSNRKKGKAAAKLPNAALIVAKSLPGQLGLLTAVCDLVLTMGDIGCILPVVEVNHAFKGGDKDASLVESFRPLGQVSPLLYLISDLIQLRVGWQVACAVGPRQLGGRSDPRFHVVMQRDCRVVRKSMGLPTYECSNDAQYGFDGGRHAQVLLQAHEAGISSYDWILIYSLFVRYRMRVRTRDSEGVCYVLPVLKHCGGGMVQGLPPSTTLYSFLPWDLDQCLSMRLPKVAMVVDEILLGLFHRVCDGDLSVDRGLCVEEVEARANRVQMVLKAVERDGWTESFRQQVSLEMHARRSDAERLLLLDFTASMGRGPASLWTTLEQQHRRRLLRCCLPERCMTTRFGGV